MDKFCMVHFSISSDPLQLNGVLCTVVSNYQKIFKNIDISHWWNFVIQNHHIIWIKLDLKSYLRGQALNSSSVGLNIRSTDEWLLSGGKGEGSLSNDHILFLANPCWSSAPRVPNYDNRKRWNHALFRKREREQYASVESLDSRPEESRLEYLLLWL